MKVIADCGATKSHWAVICSNGDIHRFTTGGINASAMSAESIIGVISETAEQISATEVSAAEIYLYIAGFASENLESQIRSTFEAHLTVASLEIQTDLLGAARAVCGHGSGIAVILGTGSNSCQWENGKIVKKVNSGGFILGDEGGAAALGKLFIADFIKGLVPDSISEDFSSRYPSDYAAIISKVYSHEESPSGYLGSLAPFIMEHYVHPYIKNLVDGNFRSFIRRTLKQYDSDRLPVSIVGGFGYALREIFTQIAQEEGLTISRFIEKPIDGLAEYHTRQAER